MQCWKFEFTTRQLERQCLRIVSNLSFKNANEYITLHLTIM